MKLFEVLQKVNDRQTFFEFVSALIEDKKKIGESWEKLTIEDYLESASAWLENSGREDISWKLMAEFLYCGKIYE
ncbi:MAG TPA: hypothetical protein VNI60_03855 [Pyrinomonadaceae bacterium]|nr:hypothetical protein [Pyrinomonadaceae bacterium]